MSSTTVTAPTGFAAVWSDITGIFNAGVADVESIGQALYQAGTSWLAQFLTDFVADEVADVTAAGRAGVAYLTANPSDYEGAVTTVLNTLAASEKVTVAALAANVQGEAIALFTLLTAKLDAASGAPGVTA